MNGLQNNNQEMLGFAQNVIAPIGTGTKRPRCQNQNMFCECGCLVEVKKNRRFISGHNRRNVAMPEEQKIKIGAANKKERVTIKCKTCESVFMVKAYRIKTAKYCSLSCKSKDIYDPTKFTSKGRVAWNKGLIGFKHSEDSIKKIIKGLVGRPKTEKTRKLLSLANTGKVRSEETKRKLSSYRGPNTSNWKGGKSFEKYTQDWNNKYKETIRERDNHECQLCGLPESLSYSKLHVHHIDYKKKRCSEHNLVTLCQRCHIKTNSKRKMWEAYFSHMLIIGADALLIAEYGRRVFEGGIK